MGQITNQMAIELLSKISQRIKEKKEEKKQNRTYENDNSRQKNGHKVSR